MTTRVHCDHCDAAIPSRPDAEPYAENNHKIVDCGLYGVAAYRDRSLGSENKRRPNEYDLCDKCWGTLMDWLKGKGL